MNPRSHTKRTQKRQAPIAKNDDHRLTRKQQLQLATQLKTAEIVAAVSADVRSLIEFEVKRIVDHELNRRGVEQPVGGPILGSRSVRQRSGIASAQVNPVEERADRADGPEGVIECSGSQVEDPLCDECGNPLSRGDVIRDFESCRDCRDLWPSIPAGEEDNPLYRKGP